MAYQVLERAAEIEQVRKNHHGLSKPWAKLVRANLGFRGKNVDVRVL